MGIWCCCCCGCSGFFGVGVTTTTLVERFNGKEIGGGGRVAFGMTIGGVDKDDNDESDVVICGDECLVADNDLSITFKSKSNVIR